MDWSFSHLGMDKKCPLSDGLEAIYLQVRSRNVLQAQTEREVKRTKKQLIILGLGLLMLFSFVAPVMAAEKVPVLFSTSGVSTTGGTTETTPSGIKHVRGAVRTATATLTVGSVVYTGDVSVDLDFVVNPIKGTTTQHYHKMTITFPVSKNPSLTEEGVFEGVLTWTADLGPAPGSIIPSTMDTHAVLQGSGGFEGYTLHLDRDPEKGSNNWMLIR